MPTGTMPTTPEGQIDYDFTPSTQTVTPSQQAQLQITLRGGAVAPAGGLNFQITSSVNGVTFTPSSSVTITAGNSGASFGYQDMTPGTDTLTCVAQTSGVNPAAKTVQVVISGASAVVDYSVTMPSAGTTGQAYPVTITLLNGAVAPNGGYAFALSTSAGANGSFGMANVTMQAGQSSVVTNYTGTLAETDNISVTSASPLNASVHTASIVLSAPAPGTPGFVWSPATLSALTGQDCGPYTLSLTNGAVAPAGGLLFALASDATDGSSFSAGAGLLVPQGQSSAQTSYTGQNAGTYHLTATPPSTGVTGAAQTVQAVFTDPPPPDSGSIDYSLTLPLNGTVGVPVTFQVDLQNGAVAPNGGYEFDLSTSSQGQFAANPMQMLEGTSRISTSYDGLVAGDHTLYVQGNVPVVIAAHSATVTLAAAAILPGFTFTPAVQDAQTGQPSGLLTLSLLNGALASSDLVFALSTNQGAGGAFSRGVSLTILAGQNSAQCTYDGGGATGAFRLTATPPPGGVFGPPQTVQVLFSPYTPVVSGGTGSSSNDLDVRVYNADGTRKWMPLDWMDSINFTLGERGGCLTGTLQLLGEWEQLQWTGTERVDVWLWGRIVYRGYVMQAQNEMSSPQRSSPTLHGCMEKLSGYLCRADLHYGPSASAEQVFSDICSRYVNRAGRIPALYDSAGVAALGLRVANLAIKGKSVSQALNALCDLFPDQLIWGCDADPIYHHDRLYLWPRADDTQPANQVYAVGGRVGAVVIPRDVTKVVNRVYLTGGKLDGTNGSDPSSANLMPNGSFEDSAGVGELTSNILQNPSFDDDDLVTGWTTVGSVIAKNFGRTGTNAVELNNDNAPQEKVYQDIPVAQNLTSVHAACYWCKRQEFTAAVQIRFDLISAGHIVASSLQSPQPMPVDNVGYTYHRYAFDWNVTYPGAYDTLRVTYILASESRTGYSGQTLVDDCSVWFDAPNAAKSWRISKGLRGAFAGVDWQNADIRPLDGDVCVRLAPSVQAQAGSYAEIATTVADRPQATPHRAYYVSFRVYAPTGNVSAQAGFRVYSQTKLKATRLGTVTSVGAGWFEVSCAAGSGNDCDSVEPFLRFTTSGGVYVDAAGLYVDRSALPPFYTPDDTFHAVVDVTKYGLQSIGYTANQSIALYGEREAEVTNENVTDAVTLDAFLMAYFRGKAVPSIQGTLTIKDAAKPIDFSSQVRVMNLPLPPPPLTPVRVSYQCSNSDITVNVELNNDRPSSAQLLRLVAAGKA